MKTDAARSARQRVHHPRVARVRRCTSRRSSSSTTPRAGRRTRSPPTRRSRRWSRLAAPRDPEAHEADPARPVRPRVAGVGRGPRVRHRRARAAPVVPVARRGGRARRAVGRIMATELPPDRPLWELSVVEGLSRGPNGADPQDPPRARRRCLRARRPSRGSSTSLRTVRPPRTPQRRSTIAVPEPLPTPLELLGRTAGELLRRPQALLEAIGDGHRAGGRRRGAGRAPDRGRPELARRRSWRRAKTSLNGNPEPRAPVREAAPRPRRGEGRRQASRRDGHGLRDVHGRRRAAPTARVSAARRIERDLIAFMPVNVRREGAEGDLGNRISARARSAARDRARR